MESLSLFIAPIFLNHQVRANIVFFIYSIAFVLILIFVFGGIFPTCFIEGTGLTLFKKISEYIISLILLGAIIQLFKHRNEFDKDILLLLVSSISLTIVAELAFTFYISAYGISNLVGHYLKIASFFLIYRALINVGLTRPYDLLFRSLQKSAERHRSILQTAMDGYWLIDNQGHLLEVSETYCRMSKYSETELLKMHISDIDAADTADDIAARIQEIIKQGEGRFQSRHKRKNGSIFDVEISVQYRNEEGGRFVCFLRDISERKQAEKTLKVSEERHASLVDAISKSGILLFIVDKDYRVRYMNKPMIQSFGNAIGKICYRDVGGSDSPCSYCRLTEVIDSLKMVYYEPTLADGRTFAITAVPYTDVDGTLCKLEIIRDITESVQLEARIQQAQRMEAVGTLAGGIAHDFNNMLGVITGNISYALSNVNKDDELFEVLFDVQESSKQAQSLTHQLLTFSKGGAPIKEVSDINRLIKEAAIFSTRGAKANCSFKLSGDLWIAEVDEGQINQVVGNLVINANQAMPNGGNITIRTENAEICSESSLPLSIGRYIKIVVEDQGIGISKKQLSNIFEPYFTTKQKGSGLGLATTYSIINRHGGYIAVYSEIDKGTVFNIYLPATSKGVKDTEEKSEPGHSGQGKILVMDDQESILKMVRRMLNRMGYETEFALNGTEAVKKFQKAFGSKESFDLVILDLTIPGGMGGAKTVIELLKIDPDVNAVVSSGYSNDPIMANYEDYGFCGVVPKPYTKEQLSEVLNKIFGDKS